MTPLDHWSRSADRPNATVGASAQASADGETIVVRITNQGDQAANISLAVPGFSGGKTKPVTWLLGPSVTSGSDWWPSKGSGNSPFQPTLISPQKDAASVAPTSGGGVDVLQMPAFSYLVVEYASTTTDATDEVTAAAIPTASTQKVQAEAEAEGTVTAVDVVVDGSQTHPVSPLYLGCHSDSGFVHQPRGFYAQMVVGESFEQNMEGICDPSCWTYFKDPSVQSSVGISDAPKFSQGLNHSVANPAANWGSGGFHGQHYLKASVNNQPATPDIPGEPGTGQPGSPDYSGGAGARNRGLGNEGFLLHRGRGYEGYLYARGSGPPPPPGAKPPPPLLLEVALEDQDSGHILAAKKFEVGSGNWTRLSYTLTPNATTACVSGAGDPTVQCGTYEGLPDQDTPFQVQWLAQADRPAWRDVRVGLCRAHAQGHGADC